jgi:hypothetical protein
MWNLHREHASPAARHHGPRHHHRLRAFGTTKQNNATFYFSSSEACSTFECSLDSATFSACSLPKKYTGLGNGTHAFSVRATDAAHNTDATQAGRTWTVRR